MSNTKRNGQDYAMKGLEVMKDSINAHIINHNKKCHTAIELVTVDDIKNYYTNYIKDQINDLHFNWLQLTGYITTFVYDMRYQEWNTKLAEYRKNKVYGQYNIHLSEIDTNTSKTEQQTQIKELEQVEQLADKTAKKKATKKTTKKGGE